jgi:hypothetical protein
VPGREQDRQSVLVRSIAAERDRRTHSAKNVGSDNGAELATYIVEKGKPLSTPVK